MIKFKTILLSVLLPVLSLAQPSITLDSCLNAAYENLAFNTQAAYISEGRTYAMEGNNHYNLPAFELNANASIQNEQISIQIGRAHV